MEKIVHLYAIGCLGGISIFFSVLMRSPDTATINILSITYFFLFFFAIFYNTITQKSFAYDGRQKEPAIPNEGMQSLMKKLDEMIFVTKCLIFVNY